MSLVGKKIIPVPAGVEISIDGDRNVTVKGAKGTLTMQHRPGCSSFMTAMKKQFV